MTAKGSRMKKTHAFRPDAGEGLELRLAPSGVATGAAADIARADAHGDHKDYSHTGDHKDHSHTGDHDHRTK